MSEMPEVRISLESNGTGTVHVGDVDISSHVTHVSIEATPMRGLDIRMGMHRAIAEAVGYGRVDGDTAAALIELGWTPPENPNPGVATSGSQ